MRLPGRGVVLADPRLAEAELIGPAKLLEIPLVSVVQAALGRVRGHREEAVVHGRHSITITPNEVAHHAVVPPPRRLSLSRGRDGLELGRDDGRGRRAGLARA